MASIPAFRLEGNLEAAATLRGRATNLLYHIRNFGAASDSEVHRIVRTYPQGTIEVLLLEGQEYVTITGNFGGGQGQRDKATWYIDVFSGVVRGNLVVAPDGPDGEPKLRAYNPTPDAFENPLQGANGKEPGQFHDEELMVPPEGRVPKAIASSYSGLMAKMIQFLNGYGRVDLHSHPTAMALNTDRDILKSGVDTTVYDFRFHRTHGLVRDPSTKTIWMVEIADSGVSAAPLPLIGVTADELQVEVPIPLASPGYDAVREGIKLFGGFPAGAAFSSSLPGYVELINSAGMSDFYSEKTFSTHPHMGWAFSDSGLSAHNVHIRVKQEGFTQLGPDATNGVPSTGYMFGAHWKVTFSFSDGEPRAVLEMVEEDYLDRRHTAYSSGGPSQSLSYFCGRELAGHMEIPNIAVRATSPGRFLAGYPDSSGGLGGSPQYDNAPFVSYVISYGPNNSCSEMVRTVATPPIINGPVFATPAVTAQQGDNGEIAAGFFGPLPESSVNDTGPIVVNHIAFGTLPPPRESNAPIFVCFRGEELVVIRSRFKAFVGAIEVGGPLDEDYSQPKYVSIYQGFNSLNSDSPSVMGLLPDNFVPPPRIIDVIKGRVATRSNNFDPGSRLMSGVGGIQLAEIASSLTAPPNPIYGCAFYRCGIGNRAEGACAPFEALQEEYFAAIEANGAAVNAIIDSANARTAAAASELIAADEAYGQALRQARSSSTFWWTDTARNGFAIQGGTAVPDGFPPAGAGIATSVFTPQQVFSTVHTVVQATQFTPSDTPPSGELPEALPQLGARTSGNLFPFNGTPTGRRHARGLVLTYSTFGESEQVVYSPTTYLGFGPNNGRVMVGDLLQPLNTDPEAGTASIFFTGYT